MSNQCPNCGIDLNQEEEKKTHTRIAAGCVDCGEPIAFNEWHIDRDSKDYHTPSHVTTARKSGRISKGSPVCSRCSSTNVYNHRRPIHE